MQEKFDDSCYPVSLNSLKINCLMYADDVILLSENAQGLQSCLDKLQSYWGLQVNIKKTKSLVFNNTGRLNATKFTFNGATIESVTKYSYLGVTFAISGSFTNAKTEGLKVYFRLRK